MNIGLFFGSFNPIHIGHIAIASYMAQFTELKQVWFVVSPQSPFKQNITLLQDYKRLDLVHTAIEGYDYLRACDIEFHLPKPSYTIHTLEHLKEKFPNHIFALIMGADNLQTIHKWKNYKIILSNHKVYVYPRIGFTPENSLSENIIITNSPQIEISASFIRDGIKAGKNMKAFLPEKVWESIDKSNIYKI
ncbi:MAG: nicotinate (nicotinamide) nucleotide adenylyltransferase [Endomicrobiia bacterium]